MNRAPNFQAFQSSETRNTPENERPAYDYKEIAREVLARIDQRLADLSDAPRQPTDARRAESQSEDASDDEPVGDGMSPDDQSALVRLAMRGLFGLVVLVSLIGAIAYLWSHLDAAEQTVAKWSPRAILSSMTPEEKPQPVAEPGSLAAAKTLADATPAQVAASAQAATSAQAVTPSRTAPDGDKPAPAPVSPELAALLRKVDRDIAGLAQAVNELRLAQQQGQQQASEDTVKSADEIKTGVNQLARSIVKAEQDEQTTRPKPSAPSRTAAPVPVPRNRRYAPMYYSPRDAQAEFLR
jgi:hypothetical protein